MKHIQLLTLSLILGFSAYGQNYNDLFTTYKNTANQQNSGVTQYQTIDPNHFYQREFGIRIAMKKLNRQLEKVADSFGNIIDN